MAIAHREHVHRRKQFIEVDSQRHVAPPNVPGFSGEVPSGSEVSSAANRSWAAPRKPLGSASVRREPILLPGKFPRVGSEETRGKLETKTAAEILEQSGTDLFRRAFPVELEMRVVVHDADEYGLRVSEHPSVLELVRSAPRREVTICDGYAVLLRQT